MECGPNVFEMGCHCIQVQVLNAYWKTAKIFAGSADLPSKVEMQKATLNIQRQQGC